MPDLVSVLDEIPLAGAAWLAAEALAAGLARGFSASGMALIVVPIVAMVLGPTLAAPLHLAVHAFAVAVLTPVAWRIVERRESALLALGVALGIPAGVREQRVADRPDQHCRRGAGA